MAVSDVDATKLVLVLANRRIRNGPIRGAKLLDWDLGDARPVGLRGLEIESLME
jgi:hypothetical protein